MNDIGGCPTCEALAPRDKVIPTDEGPPAPFVEPLPSLVWNDIQVGQIETANSCWKVKRLRISPQLNIHGLKPGPPFQTGELKFLASFKINIYEEKKLMDAWIVNLKQEI